MPLVRRTGVRVRVRSDLVCVAAKSGMAGTPVASMVDAMLGLAAELDSEWGVKIVNYEPGFDGMWHWRCERRLVASVVPP